MIRQLCKLAFLTASISLICYNAIAADVRKLDNGKPLSGLTGAAGSEQFFMLDVPAGATKISIAITGGSGDADLYVKAGALPTTSSYDCRPYLWGNEEQCSNLKENNVPYYIMITAYQDFASLTLNASYTTGGNEDGGKDDGGSDDDITGGSCSLSATQQALLDAHNQARATARSCGGTHYSVAPALTWNCKLAAAAHKHSQDMATNNFMDHTGSDGSSPGDRIAAEGYNFSYWAENVAAGYTTVDQVMNAWLNSSGHCSNIMSQNVTELGADLVTNSNSSYSTYWTGAFGRPQ